MAEVLWREWGDEAFDEARRLDRPILLDIGAVWCHWCHVMDHGIDGDPVHTGTYSNPAIIEAINRDYIPIKVDNDRRPDINARYNMGGWPTTAFLTPTGEPLYGATYLTPDQMFGLLERIGAYYATNKAAIVRKVQQYAVDQAQSLLTRPASGELSEAIVEFVAREVKSNFDPAFGGFGSQPKFPHPDALNFAIERYAQTGDEELRIVAEKTLTQMSSGGTYDQFAGGFFRYSTTRDWSIPHYEKMLEDNSRLMETFLNAFQVFGDEYYKDVAVDIKRFLLDVLFDQELGTFAGSQDADKEDEYYGRPLSERELMPTPFIDWTVYADWNASVATAFVTLYRQIGDDEALTIAIRLYEFLSTRVAPYHYFRDGRGQGAQHQMPDYVSLLGAALDLFETTGVRRYMDEARGIADIMLSDLFSDEAHQFRDIPKSPAALGALATPRFDQEDNAHASMHLIRLTALTGSTRYQRTAEQVLIALSTQYRQQSYFSSAYARAVTAHLTEPVHVVIVGDLLSTEFTLLKFAAFRTFVLNITVELRSAENSGEYPPDSDNRAIAYVCIGTTCSRPTHDPEALVRLLKPFAEIAP